MPFQWMPRQFEAKFSKMSTCGLLCAHRWTDIQRPPHTIHTKRERVVLIGYNNEAIIVLLVFSDVIIWQRARVHTKKVMWRNVQCNSAWECSQQQHLKNNRLVVYRFCADRTRSQREHWYASEKSAEYNPYVCAPSRWSCGVQYGLIYKCQ